MKTDKAIVAEFDGWKERPAYPGTYWKEGHSDRPLYQMMYDTSWDWLMPVVEKIEEIEIIRFKFHVKITIDECRIGYRERAIGSVPPSDIAIDMGSTKIKAVFTAVVGFIKWHNTQKTLAHQRQERL